MDQAQALQAPDRDWPEAGARYELTRDVSRANAYRLTI